MIHLNVVLKIRRKETFNYNKNWYNYDKWNRCINNRYINNRYINNRSINRYKRITSISV